MEFKVAHIWDDYLFNSFVEVHPLLLKHTKNISSFTVGRTLWDNGQEPDQFTFAQRKLPLNLLHSPPTWFRVINSLQRRYFTSAFLKFAKNTLRLQKPSILHFHFGFTVAQYPQIASSAPFVVTFYGSDISSAFRSNFWKKRYSSVLGKAHCLLVLCEESKKRLVELGCDPGKITVWNLPAGIEKYPYRGQITAPTVPRIIIAARFVEKKGHNILLDALAILKEKNIPFEAKFLGYGSGKAEVENKTKQLGLGSQVKIFDTEGKGDFATFYYSLLKESDFFVLPSIQAENGDDEGGPALTMVCAQAAGLPVVCTDFPGSEITMREGETGYFTKQKNPADLAEKMEKMIKNRAKWEPMGRLGSEIAFQNFSEISQLRKLQEIYQSAIK